MNRFLALVYFLLALVGFDVGSSQIEHRESSDGVDVLLSRTHVEAGVTRFGCVHSASGRCHYLVLPRDCDPAPSGGTTDACSGDAIARFTLAQGDSHQVSGLQRFQVCVGQHGGPDERTCRATGPGNGPAG